MGPEGAYNFAPADCALNHRGQFQRKEVSAMSFDRGSQTGRNNKLLGLIIREQGRTVLSAETNVGGIRFRRYKEKCQCAGYIQST